jgi:hypothetical protein
VDTAIGAGIWQAPALHQNPEATFVEAHTCGAYVW